MPLGKKKKQTCVLNQNLSVFKYLSVIQYNLRRCVFLSDVMRDSEGQL